MSQSRYQLDGKVLDVIVIRIIRIETTTRSLFTPTRMAEVKDSGH